MPAMSDPKSLLNDLFEAFHMQAQPSGGGFTCKEAVALCALYAHFGLHFEAQELLQAHTLSDEPGDDHYVGSD